MDVSEFPLAVKRPVLDPISRGLYWRGNQTRKTTVSRKMVVTKKTNGIGAISSADETGSHTVGHFSPSGIVSAGFMG